jgi:hypothetical protein
VDEELNGKMRAYDVFNVRHDGEAFSGGAFCNGMVPVMPAASARLFHAVIRTAMAGFDLPVGRFDQ